MITIKDVAQHAKVSITTVSHVINSTRFVGEETRKRVHAAIEHLRYVPSAAARSLKTNRTHTIGMIIPNNSNPFFAEVIRGIESECYEAGYNVILCNSDDSPVKQSQYIRVLHEKQVDGLIVLSSGEDAGLFDLLSATGLPQVVVDRETGDRNADLVGVDHELGGYLATSHLLSLGHRRIACITGPLSLAPARQRVAGYERALREAGLVPSQSLLHEADFTSASGHSAMSALLTRPQRPTGVFACNDLMALGAICAAASAGLRIPQDLSIVGFDDVALAAFTNPPLTTVAQPMHATGALAAKVLIERITGRHKPVRREVLQPELRIRQSTAALVGDAA
jgi:LacI family transcriptional regulator